MSPPTTSWEFAVGRRPTWALVGMITLSMMVETVGVVAYHWLVPPVDWEECVTMCDGLVQTVTNESCSCFDGGCEDVEP